MFTSYYDSKGYSEDGKEESLLSCSPVAAHCQVSCDIRWDPEESDQWSCHSDFVNWIISFVSFVAIHTLGTVSNVFYPSCIGYLGTTLPHVQKLLTRRKAEEGIQTMAITRLSYK
jgi:hypothetical protein